MSPYIISYLRKYVDPSIHNNHVVWLSAASLAAQGGFMPLSGMLIRVLGLRVIVFVSCVIYSGGIMLCYFTITNGFGNFMLTQNIMLGMGLGCCYSPLISLAIVCFPKQQGLVIGLCTCGFGTGAIVLTPVQTALINPSNIFANNETQWIIGQTFINDDTYLSIVELLGAVVNAVGCIIWGSVGDVLSFKVPLYVNSLVYATVLATFPFVITLPMVNHYLYAIWVMLIHSCVGGNFVLLPFAISRAFGQKQFATKYGIVFTALVS
ncbi:unnamed protein product [Schistocephalus solidus]|uniref:MFS domain-containing protein n=1 Tax=Schistocephalus solidus TaxID=70667 RepID=A0A183SMR7_SCHSO|nr:unnamed protein product [Schistocephalus solidus]